MQVNPKLKVNQLRQMIDLEIMGIHIDLRAVDLVPRDQSLTFQKARRSCKRWLDYRENKKCYKRLLLVKNDSGSDRSIDKSYLFALLLVIRQGSAICILKLCRLDSRLRRRSGVLKLVINKIRRNEHPLLLHAIRK